MKFEKGNRAKVVGPSVLGQTKDMGHIFTIFQIGVNGDFYTNGQEYCYPASSLELVEDELKIGDWVIVKCYPTKIFQIESTDYSDWSKKTYYLDKERHQYPATSLRKLTSEEIQQHAKPQIMPVDLNERLASVESDTFKLDSWKRDVSSRLSAIEKRMDAQKDAIIEADLAQKVDGKNIAEIEEDLDKIYKRLSQVKSYLKGKMPEVIDSKKSDEIVFVTIQKGKFNSTIGFEYINVAQHWCEKVLDSMRET
jgi:hypothetical protein